MDFLDDLFGKKYKKRQTLADNKTRGRVAEKNAMLRDTIQGYDVERTGRGHDYVRRKKDILTGKTTRTEYIEVKSGNAKLSELQTKTKNRKSNYRVERENRWGF